MDAIHIHNNFPVRHKVYEIQQGYIAFSKGMTHRIRRITKVGSEKQKWYHTFKQKVKNRVIELETPIDERDGTDLWEVCVGKLKKHRYVFDNNNATWELDFFLKGEMIYFILLEVELKEGAPRIPVPEFLKSLLVYEVDLTDDRFSNKRLGDVDYAQSTYNELQEIHNDNDEIPEWQENLPTLKE